MVCPPPRLRALALSHSLARKFFERRQQKSTKPPLLGIDAPQAAFFEKMRKKRLREVLGVVRRVPPPSNERVKRVPVALTKLRERGLGLRGLVLAGVQDDRPERGRETRQSDRRVHVLPRRLTSREEQLRRRDIKIILAP